MITGVDDPAFIQRSTSGLATLIEHPPKAERPAKRSRRIKRLKIRRSPVRLRETVGTPATIKPLTAVNCVLTTMLGHSRSARKATFADQSARCSTQRSVLDERNLTLKTQQENRTIREKLTEYDEFWGKRYVSFWRW